MRILHFRTRSTSECMRKHELALRYISANGFAPGFYPNVTLPDGQTHPTKPGNMSTHHTVRRCLKVDLRHRPHDIESLKGNTASILAFIEKTFVDGLAILHEEQVRKRAVGRDTDLSGWTP